jgi:ribonuclease D
MTDDASKPSRKHRRDPRYEFRARSHASAHADARPPEPIPQHPLICRDAPSLISSPAGLAELIEHVRSVGAFAYDSEFIGETSYYPKLCLIQVATAQRIALIDALADLDLGGFWKAIADPAIEKIVHAGQQDLEPVFRQSEQPPARIFDTQVAAGFIGLAYPVGLSKLVRELTGANLGKGFTFTHWDSRPLTPVQIRYAADDVRYLPALRDAIGKRLSELNHVAWAEQECAALCDPSLYATDLEADYLRVRGAGGLSAQGLAVLRELYAWRESAARNHNSPPRSYLRDDILVELAKRPPKSAADLDKVRGLPRPVEQQEGGDIVAATQRGLSVPAAECPPPHQSEETPLERFAVDSFWATAQAWCSGRSVDPNLVTSRQEIARLYRAWRGQGPAPESRLLHGWRYELLGRILEDLLRNGARITLRWTPGGLRSDAGNA